MKRLNKNGFTLVEIIAVIAILALIIILVLPNITKSSEGARKKAYETKVAEIERAAEFYAQDNFSDYVKKAKDNKKTIYDECITVGVLIPNYIEPDGKEKPDDIENTILLDPKTNESMNSKPIKITININNKKITVKYGEPCEQH